MTKILSLTSIAFLLACMTFGQTRELDSMYQLSLHADNSRKAELYAAMALKAGNNHADTALYFAKESWKLAENISDPKIRMDALSALGRNLSIQGSFHVSIKYFRQMLEIAEKQKNDSAIAVGLNGLGTAMWHLGQHAESLENLFNSLSIRERIKDVTGAAIAKTNIGMVYQSQEKITLAEKYVRESLETLEKEKYHPIQLQTMHTLANLYGMQGKISEALKLDERGITLANQYGDSLALSLFYDNMGNCFLYSDPPNYSRAIEYFSKTLAIDSSFSNKKQMSDSYVNLGDAFLQQKKYAEAVSCLQRSADLAQESGYAQGKAKALQLLSNAHRLSGNNDQAYAALMAAMRVKDSVVNASSEASIAEMQVAYDTEKKQQQITLQKEQLSKKNYILLGSILLFVTIVLLAISYYLRYRLKQKARLQNEIMKQQDMASRAVINAEEEERKRIARDLHDGVGQLMSAARMNLSVYAAQARQDNVEQKASLDKIITLVDEGCREIRQVSHEMIPNALLKKSLAAAIADFLDKIDSSSLQVHFSAEGMDERFDTNTEIVLYRVIQECVNNVIKHAGATRLDISLFKDADGISATIEDNGKGFDPLQQPAGIGLKNIRTRVEYLKGTVDIDSAPGRGTVVSLHVS